MIVSIVYPCETLYFDDHYHAYAVDVKPRREFVSNLADPNVLHGRRVNQTMFVGLKYFVAIITNHLFGQSYNVKLI